MKETAKEVRSLPRIWPDSTVIILGSGPSIKKLDLGKIWKYRTIAINHSFRLGPADMLWFGDKAFYDYNKSDIHAFAGLKCTCCTELPEKSWPDIKRVRRDIFRSGIMSDRTDMVCWNRNSGLSAINVAYHLGAKRVVLAGFDMDEKSNKSHFHTLYGKDRIRKSYDAHLRHCDAIARDAQVLGLEILNLNPTSCIKQFPFITLEQI